MADFVSTPSIAVVESAGAVTREGDTEIETKRSLESLASRSDSASADENEESEQASLAVPGSKARNTGRKGRKISVNETVKVGRTPRVGDRVGRRERVCVLCVRVWLGVCASLVPYKFSADAELARFVYGTALVF